MYEPVLTKIETEADIKMKTSMRLMSCLVTLLLCISLQAKAAPEAVREFEGGHEYRLANGLKLVLLPDEAKPVVAVNITYLVGSRHEGYGERGMAHLLEHMMFKGSAAHPDIPAELSKHGGQANGTTWYDRTNYYEVIPEGEEHLAWALSLEADRMVNSAMRAEDLAKEMTVVRNEWEAGENSPFRVLRQRIFSTAYLWHNYGQATIGARSDLENVSIERLRDFYRRYYQPDNAVLVIAGNFKAERALELTERFFGKIAPPGRVLQETYTVEPAQDGERQVILRRVGDVPALGLAYHIPAAAHPDTAALSVLAEILDAQPAGRLYKQLVQSGQATSVSASAALLHDPGLFEIWLIGGKAQPELKAKTQSVLDELAKVAPTQQEVARAKQALANDLTAAMRSPERFGIGLSESIGSGDWRLFFLFRQQLSAVTPDDVRRVAARYLVPDNRTSGEFQPVAKAVRSEIPAVGEIAPRLEALKEGTAMLKGETIDPTPEKLQQRVRTEELSPGRKLAVLNKATKDDIVSVSLKIHLGDEQSLRGQGERGAALAEMLMRGTTLHSEQEIKDLLAAWQAEISINGSNEALNVQLQAPRRNLSDAVKLLGEILRRPRLDKKDWELLQRQWLSSLENGRNDPQTLAFQGLMKKIAPNDPQAVRYVMSVEERIAGVKTITAAGLHDFHERFYGASVMEVGVVGNVTSEEMKTMLENALGGWVSPVKPQAICEAYRPLPPETVVVNTPDKENAVVVGGQPWRLKRDAEDYPALLLANEILGGGFLNSRLATRIRQQEGLSYSVGSSLQAGSIDDNGRFIFYAICAPQNAKRLEAALREELVRIAEGGVSEAEVEKAREGLLKALSLQRSQDQSLARIMTDQLDTGRSFLKTAELEARLKQLRAAEVSAVLKRYLKPQELIVVRAGDWKKNSAF